MIQTLFGSLDEVQKPSFLDRMKEAVTRTRENLSERIEEVVSFGKEIDRNTGSPRDEGVTSTGNPRGQGRVAMGDGWVRSSNEAG